MSEWASNWGFDDFGLVAWYFSVAEGVFPVALAEAMLVLNGHSCKLVEG